MRKNTVRFTGAIAVMGLSLISCGGQTPSVKTFHLEVNRPLEGVIRSEPAGVSCGEVCTATFAEGTSVKLFVDLPIGSEMIGWNGDCKSATISDNTCALTVDSDKIVSVGVKTLNKTVVVPKATTIDIKAQDIISFESLDNGNLQITLKNDNLKTISPNSNIIVGEGNIIFGSPIALNVVSLSDQGSNLVLEVVPADPAETFDSINIVGQQTGFTSQSLNPQSISPIKCGGNFSNDLKIDYKSFKLTWERGVPIYTPYYYSNMDDRTNKSAFSKYTGQWTLVTGMNLIADLKPTIHIPIPDITFNAIKTKLTLKCKLETPLNVPVATAVLPYTGITFQGQIKIDPEFKLDIEPSGISYSMKDGEILLKPDVKLNFWMENHRRQSFLADAGQFFYDKKLEKNFSTEFVKPKFDFQMQDGLRITTAANADAQALISTYWLTPKLGKYDFDFTTVQNEAKVPIGYTPFKFDTYGAVTNFNNASVAATTEVIIKSDAVQDMLKKILSVKVSPFKNATPPTLSYSLAKFQWVDEKSPVSSITTANSSASTSVNRGEDVVLESYFKYQREPSAIFSPEIIKNVLIPTEAYFHICKAGSKDLGDQGCVKLPAQITMGVDGRPTVMKSIWKPGDNQLGDHIVVPVFTIPLLTPIPYVVADKLPTVNVKNIIGVSVTADKDAVTVIGDGKTASESVTATVMGSSNNGVEWKVYQSDGVTSTDEVSIIPNQISNTIKLISSAGSAGKAFILKAFANVDVNKFATVRVNVIRAPEQTAIIVDQPTLSLVADGKTPSPSVTATVSNSTGVTWTAYKADGTTPAPEVQFNPNNKASTITVTVSTPGKYVLKATADADATKFATVQVDATAPVSTNTTYDIKGIATNDGDKIILTDDVIRWPNLSVGEAWYRDHLDLSKNISITQRLYFGSKDAAGADGIWIRLAPEITSNQTVSVEFDTYQNPDVGDPADDHIAINLGASGMQHYNSHIKTLPNIEDGKEHTAKIDWDANSKTLTVYFDGELAVQENIDLVKMLGKDIRLGYIGATGDHSNLQYIRPSQNDVVQTTTPNTNTTNPYLDLEFNDCANITKDSSVNNFTGTNNGGVSCGTTTGTATFNGVNQYLRYNGLLLNDSKTVLTRVKVANSYNNWVNLITKSSGTTDVNRSLFFGYYASGDAFYPHDTANNIYLNTLNGADLLKKNIWMDLAIRYNSDNTIDIFHNGKLAYKLNYSGPNMRSQDSTSQPLDIGLDTPGVTEYFNGDMDYVKIYNRALSDSEMASTLNQSVAINQVVKINTNVQCTDFSLPQSYTGKLHVTATGDTLYNSQLNYHSDPSGSPVYYKASTTVRPELPIGYFYISTSTVNYDIGSSGDMDVSNLSTMKLCVNDSYYPDNIGTYDIAIKSIQ